MGGVPHLRRRFLSAIGNLERAGAMLSALFNNEPLDGWLRRRRTQPAAVRARIIKAHDSTCIYCLRKLAVAECVLDHVVPFVRGGADEEHNLTVACVRCNLRKHDKAAVDFIGVEPVYDESIRRWHAAGLREARDGRG